MMGCIPKVVKSINLFEICRSIMLVLSWLFAIFFLNSSIFLVSAQILRKAYSLSTNSFKGLKLYLAILAIIADKNNLELYNECSLSLFHFISCPSIILPNYFS